MGRWLIQSKFAGAPSCPLSLPLSLQGQVGKLSSVILRAPEGCAWLSVCCREESTCSLSKPAAASHTANLSSQFESQLLDSCQSAWLAGCMLLLTCLWLR